MTALELNEVTKDFGGEPVLRGLCATVPAQGITFIVGKSGSGKSVLCKLAVGLLKPTSGAIHLLGQPVHQLPEAALNELRRQAPYIVQGPALLDWLTLEENVTLAAKAVNAGSDEVMRALSRVGITDHAQRPALSVSPGVKKRAAIARALVLSPKLLFLDEPTTGLDRDAAAQVNEVLKALRNDGQGAIVVSHDYAALRKLADHVLLVADGACAFLGPTEEFLRSELPVVRQLLVTRGAG